MAGFLGADYRPRLLVVDSMALGVGNDLGLLQAVNRVLQSPCVRVLWVLCGVGFFLIGGLCFVIGARVLDRVL